MTTTISAAAILLDMDGTLVDSSAVVERVWTDWAAEHALDPAEVMKVIHGRQGHASMAILLPGRAVEENLVDNRTMLERETAETEGVVAIAGAVGLMQALADLPHALVTSASLPLATARMAAAGLTTPPVVVTAESVTASKPDPEGFLAAAEALGVPARDCVVFEDSEAGITAAHCAGMRVIGVGPLAGPHGADHLVHDLAAVRVAADGDTLTITLE
ncbi:HAD-IA family hydrolase [Agromyces sp. NPDC058104]|uniref:HAD-IA family hydrolase n=1 Tax=Agromyces sp. NPDC058104 TaxID=3346342 RepID=UPI0036DE9A1B